ncbi:MAG: DUF4360 domain-containing protein [Desulfobacteraceae bacterium]|nr:DUF4360 domain-containing protein [Desulfobacteraceae bacterium]
MEGNGMMKKAAFVVFFVVMGLVFSLNAHADDIQYLEGSDVYIYDFAYGGDGCPNGSGSAVMSPDFSKISVFFDEYYAYSAEDPRGRDRKSCNLGVAVHVPHGMTVALIKLDYRGYVDVPPGGYAAFLANYFFAGQIVGDSFKLEWGDDTERVEEDFLSSDEFLAGHVTYSPCGEDVIIRTNTSLKAYENASSGEDTFAQVDTIDLGTSIVYQLSWKQCQ